MGKMDLSDFYCTCCGNKGIPIIRSGAKRELGHLKKLFCLTCQKEVNHVEIRPRTRYTLEDFYLEYDNKNFNEQGIRKMEYTQLRHRLNNEGKLYYKEG